MKHSTKTSWKQDLQFVARLDGQEVNFDATALPGNERNGVSPKTIVLSGLAGCTGMDVAAILTRKHRINFSDFSIDVDGELTETHPKYYDRIHLTYHIRVADENREKVADAVRLSTGKYCGVHEMLSKAANITHEINYL